MAGTQYFTRTGDTAPVPIVGAAGATPPRGPQRHDVLTRLLKGTGLVAVAVLAGLIWWLIRHDATPIGQPQAAEPTQGPLTSGPFDYTTVSAPVVTTNCGAHSYGSVQDWFAEHPCERLSRGLYIAKVRGQRALVSVSVVTMPSSPSARQLYELARSNGTGNVKDLVREGTANIPHAPDVAEGQYKSTLNAPRVTIVEANFFGDYSNKRLLTRIASDARRLSELLR